MSLSNDESGKKKRELDEKYEIAAGDLEETRAANEKAETEYKKLENEIVEIDELLNENRNKRQEMLIGAEKKEGEIKLLEQQLENIRKMNDIAKDRGQTLAEMALAWLLHDNAITSVIIGASRPAQILDNIKAIENITFSPDELRAIDELSGAAK